MKQTQQEQQVLNLSEEEYRKLCEIEHEVKGYTAKNFPGILFTVGFCDFNNFVQPEEQGLAQLVLEEN